MSTQLFFTSTVPDWSRGQGDADLAGTTQNWLERALSTTRGSGVTSNTRTSVTGPTAGLEPLGNLEWISDPIDRDITLAGSIVLNLWGSESSMNANAGFGCIVERLDSTGARVSTIVDNPEIGVEMDTSASVRNEAMTPTSTNMLKGERIRVRPYFNDAVAATMASGFTLSFAYAGVTAAASGDSYITFTEDFGFLTTAPSGSQIFLTDTAAAVDPNGASYDAKEAWTSRGSGVVLRQTSSATGPTTPRLATVSGAGNFIEWFTKQLTAFTLDGLIACNVRGAESNAGINAATRVEIAITDDDGTNPVVWGASNDGVELGISEAAMTWAVAGDATAVTDGQRLRIRIYWDDAPGVAMGSGGSLLLYYAGTSAAASGDTYITLPQTVTEFAPTGDQSKSASDAGTGVDASSLTAAQAATEAATGAEVAVLTVPITASDAVVGADTSALAAVLVATDTGSGADTVPTLAMAVTDAAVGADAWVNTAQVRTDTATAVDVSLVTVPVVATDAGSGADVSVLTAAYPVTETASGVDTSLLVAALAGTDLGVAVDASSVTVGGVDVVASDAASGADTSATTAVLTVTDSATTAESIPTFAKVTTDSANAGDIAALDAGAFKTVFDSGSTTDTVLAFALTATDTATGVDAALLAVPGTATISNTLPSVIQAITGSTLAPVVDSFNRADGAIGVSDSGHTWLAQSGTWSISSNRAYRSTSEGQATVVIDSGLTSVALSADAIFAANPDSGVIFGGIDDNNYLLFSFSGSGTSLILWKRDASTFTLLSSYTVASYASTTQAIRVEWFADTGVIGLWFGGPLIGTVTLSAGDRTKYAPGTRQGLREHTTAGDRTFFDNYSASLPTQWATATASNTLGSLSTLVRARHANTTDWSNEASDTTHSGAGTQVIVVTVGV